jgi:hypothetical protein
MIQSLKRPSAIEKYWPLADVWFFSRLPVFYFSIKFAQEQRVSIIYLESKRNGLSFLFVVLCISLAGKKPI